MPEYFIVLDGTAFETRLRPALTASRRARSFAPCRALCASLLPAARSYLRRYHVGAEEPLLAAVARGLPFDRHRWRALVGEVLLFAADEIPEFQVNAETLCCLLAPEHYRRGVEARAELAPVQQAHCGTRDLTFGAAVYRPEHAGYNGREDVARLARYLAAVEPGRWTAADLRDLRGVTDDAEREDELAFAREWFPALADLYQRASARGQVLVHELIF